MNDSFELPDHAPSIEEMRPLIASLRNKDVTIIDTERLKWFIRMNRAMQCRDCSLNNGCGSRWSLWRDDRHPWPEGKPFPEEVPEGSIGYRKVQAEALCVNRHIEFLRGVVDERLTSKPCIYISLLGHNGIYSSDLDDEYDRMDFTLPLPEIGGYSKDESRIRELMLAQGFRVSNITDVDGQRHLYFVKKKLVDEKGDTHVQGD